MVFHPCGRMGIKCYITYIHTLLLIVVKIIIIIMTQKKFGFCDDNNNNNIPDLIET
jgi:hypothetical protein